MLKAAQHRPTLNVESSSQPLPTNFNSSGHHILLLFLLPCQLMTTSQGTQSHQLPQLPQQQHRQPDRPLHSVTLSCPVKYSWDPCPVSKYLPTYSTSTAFPVRYAVPATLTMDCGCGVGCLWRLVRFVNTLLTCYDELIALFLVCYLLTSSIWRPRSHVAHIPLLCVLRHIHAHIRSFPF